MKKAPMPPAGDDVDEQEDAKGKDRQFVTALARGLQILRCFTSAQPALRAADLARMTGLPQPTVWRLCYTLIQEGYLVHVDDGERLRPNFPVLALGFAAISGAPVTELARPVMERLARKYQGAVSLGVRDGMQMRYIGRSEGSDILLRNVDVGSSVPLVAAPIGWGYIAGLAPHERDALYAEMDEAGDPLWRKARPKLKQALAEYEKAGYVVSKGILHPQINAVAVPVFDDEGKVVMGLSSGGLAPIFDDAKLAALGGGLKALAEQMRPAIKSNA
jgi:DNA-binding IclR family transcriptional regulator